MKPYKACSCRDDAGKLLGRKCPDLLVTYVDKRTGETKTRYAPGHGGWYVRYEAPRSADGKRRRPRLGPFDTEREARQAAEHMSANTRTYGYADDRKLTLGEHLDDMVEHHWSRKAHTTYTRAKLAIELYFKPGLGHIRVADLTEQHILDLYAAMRKINRDEAAPSDLLRRLLAVRHEHHGVRWSKRPLSEATMKRYHAVLTKALNAKRVRKILPVNPAADISFSQRRARPMLWTPERVDRWRQTGVKPGPVMVWDREHTLTWLDHVRDDRLYALWRLATCWGPRRGELVGLDRADVRVSARKVTVLQSASTGDDDSTKSEASERTFDIDEDTATALEEWFVVQMGEQLAWSDAWVDSGKAFTREDGSPLRLDFVGDRFERLVTKAGLPPIRFHDLRHVAATMLLASGNDMKVVSEILGHASVSFTSDVYTSVLGEVKTRAAAKLDHYLKSGEVQA